MSDSPGKLSADLRISKTFKYTPIFKNSFIRQKKEQKRGCCRSNISRITGYILLIFTFVFSLIGTGFLWGTNIFQSSIHENLVLKNNSQAFEWWRKPPVQPVLRVYIFNYTNMESFLAGEEKARVEEIGPYTYIEKLEKVNVVFNKNSTISFQESRSYEFVPEKSIGSELDEVVVPNIPLISAVSTMKDQFYLVKLSLAALLNTIQAKPFVTVNIKDLLWGYNDPLFTVGRTVLALKEEIPYDRFGLFVTRNGTSSKRVTINSGQFDITQLGVISSYNGRERIDFWNSDECNRIDGTEGVMFPPHLVNTNSTLHIYNQEMCRRFPLVFKEHTTVYDDIPTLRFHQPRNVFDHPDKNPENACYCHPHLESCPPSGVFNASPCAFNAPIMVSFPHFYLGDPILLEAVDGLKPDPELHDSYVDMHPKLGVPLAGQSRVQINIMVRKASGIQHLDAFEDGIILPIAWASIGLDDMPYYLQRMFYHITFSARAFQLILMYGLPVLALVTGCVLYALSRRRWRTKQPRMITANLTIPPPEDVTP
ncbi:scavenger receptor class B member 1 [Anabrus simplex]|uniref:scavenger receptor class B member 1 n=1 Tax=Anabrus simplex TaxID=316456 RepID=UPI0034DD8715